MNRLQTWLRVTGPLLSGLLIASAPARAHHSYAMFDAAVVNLTGTVKDYQWTNPHIWIVLMVPDVNGQMIEWGIETGSPNMLRRRGWNKDSIAMGDKIVVQAHPKRDGSNQGSLIQITKADGTVLKDRDLVVMPVGDPSQTGG